MKNIFGLAFILSTSSVLAIQSYCESGYKPIAEKEFQLDLSKLNKEFVITKKTNTPPSVTSIVTQINICDALPAPTEPFNEEEVCLKQSYICRRTIHTKKEVDSIDIVQTIASDVESKLSPEFKPVKEEDDPTKSGYKYSLALNGGLYKNLAQSAVITLECDESQSRSEDPKEPEIISYNNNVLTLQWKTIYACATKVGEKVPEDKKKPDVVTKEGMSGIGIFFTIIFVLAGIYFVGGAFYNFKVYNARGLDLIPHRDFWFDLPYLIKDLFSHIVDSVMSHRRGSGGYVAV